MKELALKHHYAVCMTVYSYPLDLHASWSEPLKSRVKRETNRMKLILCLLLNFYLNMFRASLCLSSTEQDRILPHMVFCTGCAGCGCVELGREPCAVQNTICSSIRSCSPDDGHNDARNMLR